MRIVSSVVAKGKGLSVNTFLFGGLVSARWITYVGVRLNSDSVPRRTALMGHYHNSAKQEQPMAYIGGGW